MPEQQQTRMSLTSVQCSMLLKRLVTKLKTLSQGSSRRSERAFTMLKRLRHSLLLSRKIERLLLRIALLRNRLIKRKQSRTNKQDKRLSKQLKRREKLNKPNRRRKRDRKRRIDRLLNRLLRIALRQPIGLNLTSLTAMTQAYPTSF